MNLQGMGVRREVDWLHVDQIWLHLEGLANVVMKLVSSKGWVFWTPSQGGCLMEFL